MSSAAGQIRPTDPTPSGGPPECLAFNVWRSLEVRAIEFCRIVLPITDYRLLITDHSLTSRLLFPAQCPLDHDPLDRLRGLHG